MDEGIVVKRVRTGEPLSFFKAAAFLGIEPRTLSALLINDEITPNFGCKSGSKFYEETLLAYQEKTKRPTRRSVMA